MSIVGIPEEQIGMLVKEIFIEIERYHGRKLTRSLRRLLTNFMGMTMTESIASGICPGDLISGLVAILSEIDKRSDEIAFGSGDLRKN